MNKNFFNHTIKYLTLFIVSFLTIPFTAFGSHHFETVLSQKYPHFDTVDAYVFQSQRDGYTTFIMNVNPGANVDVNPFASNGLYNLHIANNKDMKEGMTLVLKFDGEHFNLEKIEEPNASHGSRGAVIAKGHINKTLTTKNGIKIWAGLAKDPFMGNAAGLGQFKSLLFYEQRFDASAFDNAEDFFAPRMVGSIVIEIPNSMLGEMVYYFISTSLNEDNHFHQVNRMANVLVTHMLFGPNESDSLAHVSERPDTDAKRKYAISGNVLRAVTLAGTQKKNPVAYADKIATMFIPDLMSYKVGTEASYSVEGLNGRTLADDAMDTVLSLWLGKVMTDRANENATRRQEVFPYVIPVKSSTGSK